MIDALLLCLCPCLGVRAPNSQEKQMGGCIFMLNLQNNKGNNRSQPDLLACLTGPAPLVLPPPPCGRLVPLTASPLPLSSAAPETFHMHAYVHSLFNNLDSIS